MTKKWKIIYWVLIAFSVVLAVVDIVCALYKDAAFMVVNALWLSVSYLAMDGWIKTGKLNDTLIELYSMVCKEKNEALKREQILMLELAELRKIFDLETEKLRDSKEQYKAEF